MSMIQYMGYIADLNNMESQTVKEYGTKRPLEMIKLTQTEAFRSVSDLVTDVMRGELFEFVKTLNSKTKMFPTYHRMFGDCALTVDAAQLILEYISPVMGVGWNKMYLHIPHLYTDLLVSNRSERIKAYCAACLVADMATKMEVNWEINRSDLIDTIRDVV